MSIWTDIVTGIQAAGGNPDAQLAAGAQAGAAAGQNAGLVETFSAFFANLTSSAMWRSLGWLALGFALFTLGLALWLHKPIEQVASLAAV